MWRLVLLPAYIFLVQYLSIVNLAAGVQNKPGCKAEPTDLPPPIVLWFLLKDEFNMHLIEPVLLPVTCCMLRSCVLLELCLSCARLTVSVKTFDSLWSGRGASRGRASRVSARFDSLPLVILRCRVLSCFKRTPEVVWHSATLLSFFTCPRACHGSQGTLEMWSLASQK